MAHRLISRPLVQQIAWRSTRIPVTTCTASTTAANAMNNSSSHVPASVNLFAHTKRWYQTTIPLLDETKPPTPASADDDEDYVARHKRGLSDPSIPDFQNPLHEVDTTKDKIFDEDFAPGETMPEVPLPPFSDGPDDICAPPHLHELADEMVQLNMLEMTELIKKIQLHFGMEESDYSMDTGGGSDGGGETAAPEPVVEQTLFDLRLEGFDAKAKIKVIKEVRAIANLGLKEAKDLVEGAPKVVLKGIKKEVAEEHKKTLVDAGAIVEIV